MLRIEAGPFLLPGAESCCDAQLLTQRDTKENKSGAGLSVIATVWWGSEVWGLTGSHGREEVLPDKLGRRSEAETLKNKWENFATL